ncbi:hypothetical protein BHE74_00018420 [Ensete ventricosum]|nr:hypothetical protein BHE74_00018420 [Ensete ventricosum]RZR78606.1 hypothetical protein BHM03_00004023 [Ensete ventricosum]
MKQELATINVDLHVVEAVKGFVAHGAGELGVADEDFGGRGDPVLTGHGVQARDGSGHGDCVCTSTSSAGRGGDGERDRHRGVILHLVRRVREVVVLFMEPIRSDGECVSRRRGSWRGARREGGVASRGAKREQQNGVVFFLVASLGRQGAAAVGEHAYWI